MSYLENSNSYPRSRESARFSTVLNGRYDAALDPDRPALTLDSEPSTGRWRRFVQILNLRGDTMGDE